MKRLQPLGLTLITALLIAADAPTSQPTTAPALSGKLGNPIALLAHADLSDWTWVPGKTKATVAEVWSIKDGVLHSEGKPSGYLRTNTRFTSYVLRARFRHLTPGNGGIMLRISGDDKVWPRCLQVQGERGTVGDLIAMVGYPIKTDPARAARDMKGKTVRLHPEAEEKPLGEWNDLEIILDAGDLKVTVNATPQNEAHDCDIAEGYFGLQAEGAVMEFKDLTLTPIEPK